MWIYRFVSVSLQTIFTLVFLFFRDWSGLDISCWLPSDLKMDGMKSYLESVRYYQELKLQTAVGGGVRYDTIVSFHNYPLWRFLECNISLPLPFVQHDMLFRSLHADSCSLASFTEKTWYF